MAAITTVAGGEFGSEESVLDICPAAANNVGACCVGSDCVVTTRDCCDFAGGDYQGAGTSCFIQAAAATEAVSAPDRIVMDLLPPAADLISIPAGVTIGDLDVAVTVDHSWIGDLEVTLTHLDSGISAVLWNRECYSRDGMAVVFDDDGNELVCGQPTTGRVAPGTAGGSPLDAFEGPDSAGLWRLTVADHVEGDFGYLVEWSLQVTAAGDGVPSAVCEPLCGDLDGDVDVDPDDQAEMIATLGSSTGDGHFNPLADYFPEGGDGLIGNIDSGIWFQCYVDSLADEAEAGDDEPAQPESRPTKGKSRRRR